MCSAQVSESDRPARLTPWHVVEVQALSDHRLDVRFADGTRGRIDLSRVVHDAEPGVFSVLSDSRLFGAVRIEHGAIAWPGDIDLAPDAAYREIVANGEWIVS